MRWFFFDSLIIKEIFCHSERFYVKSILQIRVAEHAIFKILILSFYFSNQPKLISYKNKLEEIFTNLHTVSTSLFQILWLMMNWKSWSSLHAIHSAARCQPGFPLDLPFVTSKGEVSSCQMISFVLSEPKVPETQCGKTKLLLSPQNILWSKSVDITRFFQGNYECELFQFPNCFHCRMFNIKSVK